MSVKPIFFALDGKELSEFTETLEKLKGVIYGVKVGLEMFTAEGPSSVETLKNWPDKVKTMQRNGLENLLALS